jgi:putative DNA primase/helicase
MNDTPDTDDPAAAALAYARDGHPVLPLKPDGSKEPNTRHGKDDADTDRDDIQRWWAEHPDDHIGLRPAQDECVIDVEGPEGDSHVVNGLPTYAELVEKLGSLVGFPVAETPSGGLHIWGSHDLAPDEIAGHPAPGIDVKTHSGYAVAPPAPKRRWREPLKGKPPRLSDAWQQWMRKVAKSTPKASGQVFEPTDRDAYVDTAVAGELDELRTTTKGGGRHGGRIMALFAKAARLDELGVRRDWARDELMGASDRNGVLAEKGEAKCARQIDNAFAKVGGNGSYIPRPPRLKTQGHTMTAGEISKYETRTAVSDSKSPAEIHRGQARFAYLLAADEDGRLLHVYRIGWHYWDGKRWRPDDKGKARRAVLALNRKQWRAAFGDTGVQADCRKVDTATGINGVLEIASALEPFAAVVDNLDADPYLLNVANGTVDLHTLELKPHNSTDKITKVCNGAYDPDAATPVWDAFLARVLPDEDVCGFVQRLAGLSLLGEVREHVLPIFMGTGRNGKGTLYLALFEALGDYAGTADPELFMHRENAHPTGEMDLLGKRLVVVSESDSGRRLAEATMKRLTGGDRIKARLMRKDFVEFTPSHLAVLVTNHLPKVSGDDPAVWARILVVPFDVVIPEQERDTELGAKLRLEADGILTWCVAGLRDYLDHGLAAPKSVRVATDTYQQRQDAVGRFIADCCYTTAAVQATTSQLHVGWQLWAVAEGCEPLGRGHFGDALDRHGYPAAKAAHGNRWRKGICLKTVDDDGESR